MWLGPEGSFIAVHVDDMAVGGTNEQLDATASHLKKHLELKDFGPITK